MNIEQRMAAHKLPQRKNRILAATNLNTAVINWRNEAAKVRDKESETAPVTVIKAEASLGKTTAVLKEIANELKRNAGLRVLFMVPSLDLGEELRKKALDMGIESARLLRGRSQVRPDATSAKDTMCAKAEIAETLSSLSISVTDTLCRKKLESGEFVECPFASACPYLKQMEEAKESGLIIASHQYLSVRLDALKDVDWLIIDESFWQVLCADKRIDIGRFTSSRGVGDGFRGKKGEGRNQFEGRFAEACFELMEATELFGKVLDIAQKDGRQPKLADYRNEGFTPEHCRYLAGLEFSRIRTPDIHPGMDFEEQKDRLQKAEVQEAFSFARVWKILAAELETSRQGEPHGLVIERGVLNPRSGELGNYIHAFWSRNPRIKDTPTLIIDADADEAIIERFFPGAAFIEIAAQWQNVEIIQITDKTGSAQSLAGTTRRNDVFNAALDMSDRLDEVIAGQAERRPLLVSQKAVIDDFKQSGDLDSASFDGAWFGNLRGKDGWKHAAGIIVAGRIEPSVAQAEGIGRSIWFAANEPLTFIQPDAEGVIKLPKAPDCIRTKDGQSFPVQVSYHPENRIDRVIRQVREAELMQAIARIRPVHRSAEIPAQVLVLTNIPLPIEVDRICTWAEAVPDRFDVARLAGCLPEIAQDMADAYPGLFKSKGAVRTAASRREERTFPAFEGRAGALQVPYNNKMGGVTGWVRVSYERDGKGNRGSGAAWMKIRKGDNKATIAARLAHFLPDAYDFDVSMPEPAFKQPDRAEKPAAPSEHGWRHVTPQTLILAQSINSAENWWHYLPKHKKSLFEKRSY